MKYDQAMAALKSGAAVDVSDFVTRAPADTGGGTTTTKTPATSPGIQRKVSFG